ncbi:FAD dependent oxidoreductase [Pseudomonas syringae pv. ribicola]|uniref:FAD dependent oxidoreductase n=1 Tax=Pseudomonas syringae pv. ribicola TaxID=55398 RepID=A0A0P9ZDL2_PSESI|nr:FAD dependent oxidoreductase [Pseudomonas syringae pv. ribicola]
MCKFMYGSLVSAIRLSEPHRQSLPRQPCQTVIHASGWLLSSIYAWRCGGVIHQ